MTGTWAAPTPPVWSVIWCAELRSSSEPPRSTLDVLDPTSRQQQPETARHSCRGSRVYRQSICPRLRTQLALLTCQRCSTNRQD
jgi:hypothetical protein